MVLLGITGKILVEDFQALFKAVSKKTASSPSGMHYSIWKVLARDDGISQWLCIMMSLSSVYVWFYQ